MNYHLWTDAEKKFVKDHCHHMKDHELAARLTEICGRPITGKAVCELRVRIGIKKVAGKGVCRVASYDAPKRIYKRKAKPKDV